MATDALAALGAQKPIPDELELGISECRKWPLARDGVLQTVDDDNE